MTASFLDHTLMDARSIAGRETPDDGLGLTLRLSCGHRIWFASEPRGAVYCGVCLDHLVQQIREIQAGQAPL